MTKEEAIEILSDIRAEYNIFGEEEEATKYHCLSWAIKALKQEPVKTGKWIETKEWGGRNFCCSECRFCFIVDTYMLKPMWNYCPNCGAKMEGEEE